MRPITDEQAGPRPFIKWVGGKRQLLPEILRRAPMRDLTAGTLGYAEPFVGGGAVFFALAQACQGLAQATLNDANPRLIGAYRALQESPEALLATLRALEADYLALPADGRRAFYLAQRKRFNALRGAEVECAALLIFLNRTGFNGLYRENARGDFNVPFGRHANPTICDAPTLMADAVALRGVRLLCGDFARLLDTLTRPSFVYLDPPYKPISATSSFNSYTKRPFDDAEQCRLAAFCRELDRRGHRFLLSNSDPGDGFFDRLYAGFRIERVRARRSVNANPAKRGPIDELLISNQGA